MNIDAMIEDTKIRTRLPYCDRPDCAQDVATLEVKVVIVKSSR